MSLRDNIAWPENGDGYAESLRVIAQNLAVIAMLLARKLDPDE